MEKVIFLGTSAGIPTLSRNVPSIALSFSGTNEFWLFDCGEGTQRQIQQADLKLSKLTHIFISHLHGDHIFGLPGLLATRGMLGIKKDIHIFGPIGLEGYLKSSLDYSFTYIPYPYYIHPIEKEKFTTSNMLWKEGDIAIDCALLNHYVESFGFAVIKKNVKRNILVDRLVSLGILPGPVYKKLKEDGFLKLPDGRVLKKEEFILETIDIKKFCYCGDTAFSANAIVLSEGADLLIHEATFCADKKNKAAESYHSTVDDALKVAQLARVKKLVLTHISPRYDSIDCNTDQHDEFKKNIKGTGMEIVLAEDFLEVKI